MKTTVTVLFVLFNIVLNALYSQNALDEKSHLADSLYQIGKTDSAILISNEIIKMAEDEGNVLNIIDAYTSRGVYLRSSGKLEEAAKAYDIALKHVVNLKSESEESLQSVTTLYNNLSALYLDMKNPEKAFEYALKAAQSADKCSDKIFRSQIYSVASSVFITQKQHKLAKEYLQKAIKLADETGQPEAELNSITYYMLTLFRTGAPESEYSVYMKRASKLSKEINSFMSLVNYYQVLFYIQNEKKDYGAAIVTAKNILSLDGISNYPFLQYDVYNNLHQIYGFSHDYKNAYEVLEKAKTLSDSLFEDSKGKQIEELSAKYESAKKELEIKELNEQQEKDRLHILFLVIALSFVIIIAVFVTVYLQKSKRLQAEQMKSENEARKRQFAQIQRKTELKLTRDYIDKLEKERMRLAGELHDGICNDLYALEVNIRSDNKPAPEEWLSSLSDARENIRRVSHELLPPEFKEASIDQVIYNYIDGIGNAGCKISFKALPEDCDWTVLPDNISLNIYRIIQEAVSNSLKYAEAKDIEVKMEWELPDLVISICDNGKGIKDSKKGGGKRTLKERTEAINAKYEIKSTDKGTCIYVRIPIFR